MAGTYKVVLNIPYPNRLQILLSGITGPLIQSGTLGNFDPRRDLNVYNNGETRDIDSFYYDPDFNRYLVYMKRSLDPTKVTQAVFHVPNPPFQDFGSLDVSGFCKIANVTSLGDQTILNFYPEIGTINSGDAVVLKWQTQSIPQIRITGGSYDSGVLVNTGAGQVTVPNVTASTTYTIYGLDSSGTQLVFNSLPVEKTAAVVVN